MAILADGRDQGEIAEAAGVDEGQLSRWKGGATPKIDSVRKLVLELGISGHWLLTGEGDMLPKPLPAEVQGFRDMAAIVDRVRAAAKPMEKLGDLVADGIRQERGE